MLGRRQFLRGGLALAGLGVLAGCKQPIPPVGADRSRHLPTPTRLPPRVPEIGVLWADAPGDLGAVFGQALVDLGYAVGRDLTIDMRWVRARSDLLPQLASELVQRHVDVIVAPSTPAALVAQQATATIPIVMVASGDPVESTLVASLARPGGNLTGLTSFTPELSQERLGLLTDLLPSVTRVAVLWNAADLGKAHEFRATQSAAWELGLQVHALAVRSATDIDRVLPAAAAGPADALIVLGDALTHSFRSDLVTFARQAQLPTLFDRREYYVDEGGLIAYGPSFPALFRRAAAFVDTILRGTRPAELPVEPPVRFEMIINLPAAQALGLTIPQSVLTRATEILQ